MHRNSFQKAMAVLNELVTNVGHNTIVLNNPIPTKVAGSNDEACGREAEAAPVPKITASVSAAATSWVASLLNIATLSGPKNVCALTPRRSRALLAPSSVMSHRWIPLRVGVKHAILSPPANR